jgi:hypothetical protein
LGGSGLAVRLMSIRVPHHLPPHSKHAMPFSCCYLLSICIAFLTTAIPWGPIGPRSDGAPIGYGQCVGVSHIQSRQITGLPQLLTVWLHADDDCA